MQTVIISAPARRIVKLDKQPLRIARTRVIAWLTAAVAVIALVGVSGWAAGSAAARGAAGGEIVLPLYAALLFAAGWELGRRNK